APKQNAEAEEPKPEPEENDFDVELAEAMIDDEDYGAPTPRQSDDETRGQWQPAYEEPLSEKLLAQLRLLDLSERELRIAEEIIGNLDDDGYLRCDLDVIRDGLLTVGIDASKREIESALKKIWRLDPPGVGARDLQECLLIQLDAMASEEHDDEREEARQLARKMLSQHYRDFAAKRYEKLLQDLACSPDELKRAFALIQSLNPKPGLGQTPQIGNYVVPDFIVTLNGEELVLTANDRSMPQIRLSRHYKKLISDKSQAKETKEFLREKLNAAKNFLNAIQMRKHTLLKVMTAIMNRQREFFIYGQSKLKPMILKDIAEETKLDIATISRVVNGKYVQTDFGVFELKHFFSKALETESGDEISNRVIKQIIKEVIEKEDAAKPLSDDKLAELLSERGFKLARRTVTKYREQLGIPIARLRKKIDAIK
ncbi:MAG: RNA polymerase factor sigma-54, partial [Chloroherpetonaceae bacterium]|nr:RNA polymerase factor sigma-54 [Chloroherpetonaceae bacterium]